MKIVKLSAIDIDAMKGVPEYLDFDAAKHLFPELGQKLPTFLDSYASEPTSQENELTPTQRSRKISKYQKFYNALGAQLSNLCKKGFSDFHTAHQYAEKRMLQNNQKIAFFLCADNASARNLAEGQAERTSSSTCFWDGGYFHAISDLCNPQNHPISFFVPLEAFVAHAYTQLRGIPIHTMVILAGCCRGFEYEQIAVARDMLLSMAEHYPADMTIQIPKEVPIL